MQVPANPHNPGEWFDLAQAVIADEGVFSADQIALLQLAIHLVEQGVAAADRNSGLSGKP
jgi:hypothetical protein